MGTNTGIEWCDHTFNPWWGCTKVSPACEHCYAETFSTRVGQKVWGVQAPRRFFGPKHWQEPERWNAAAKREGVRRRVFCASMADVFEDREDLVQPRADLFLTIEETPHLDWLLLTKRPEQIARLMPNWWNGRPWPNVWLGTTAENQQYADARIPHLLRADRYAAVLFLSCEPLLGPIDLRSYLPRHDDGAAHVDGEQVAQIGWVIVGGESGAHFRAPQADWFRSVRDQCETAGVPFFFKQWGGRHPNAGGASLDGREWKQVPHAGAVQAIRGTR